MLLKLQQISKSYSSGSNPTGRVILDQLDLEVNPGERIAIVGPSGSGKTTLLNLIGTLDRPDSGTMVFENQDLSGFSDQQLAGFRNEKIGSSVPVVIAVGRHPWSRRAGTDNLGAP